MAGSKKGRCPKGGGNSKKRDNGSACRRSKRKRKRSPSPATSESSSDKDDDRATIQDISIRIERAKLNKKAKEGDRTETDFRVHYDIMLSGKCCGKNSIIATSTKEVWGKSTSEARAIAMKEIVTNAIDRHKRKADENGAECTLNLDSDIQVMLRFDQFWYYLWNQGELQVREELDGIQKASAARQKGHATRVNDALGQTWEEGGEFQSKDAKHHARKKVYECLERWSGKSTQRLYTILSHVVSKLSRKISKDKIPFDENKVLSLKNQRRVSVMTQMMATANTCIKGLQRRISKDKLALLTGVAAIFLPPKADRVHGAACKILGMNRCASYVKQGMANRIEFNAFQTIKGDITVGEMVVTRDGYGKLIAMSSTVDDNNSMIESITVSLEPWECEKVYNPASKARVARLEPTLDEYGREQRSDTTPEEWKESIEKFLRDHNHTSPNTRDIIKRRNPKYPACYEEAVRIYRYELWDQIWSEFEKGHGGIASKIKNTDNPHECPTMIRTYAPWELCKGKDSSCLCTNCEGTNNVKRGANAAIKAIEPLKTIIEVPDEEEVEDDDESLYVDSDSDSDDDDSVSLPSLVDRDDESIAPADADEEDIENETNDDGSAARTESETTISQEERDKKIGAKLLRLFEILSTTTKYATCVSCLPCLQPDSNGEIKLENAKFGCVNGDCPKCGFDKVWSKGIRNEILVKEYDSTKREWVEKLNPASPFATDDWLRMVDYRAYEYKEAPALSSHAKEVDRQARATRPPDDDDGDYSPGNESKSARNLVLVTHRGTVIDYLDHAEKQIAVHILHRNLVSSEHRSKRDYDRNSRPWSVAKDIYFSENGPIENFDKIQSEHWQTKQYTLFMAILSFMLADEWNKSTGILEVGQEVTVDGELYIKDEDDPSKYPAINHDSYWAQITSRVGGDEDLYTVTDAEGSVSNIQRSRLRARKKHTIACPSVSDDKKHDRFAMQHFTTKELVWVEEYMNNNFKNDIPTGKITCLHQHSDNAASHFKSTGSMEYFTTLIRDRGGPSKCRFVYTFGAPGHGKGFFDGVGGVLKNKIHSLIKASKTAGDTIEGPESGYISSVEDVYLAMKAYFESGPDGKYPQCRRKGGKNQIDKFQFFKYLIEEEPIRRAEETFQPLENISSSYQFSVSSVGLVHSRLRSCWCLKCYDAMIKGSLNWNADQPIYGCSSSAKQTTDIYTFTKKTCKKLTGVDAKLEIRDRAKTWNEMASQLTPGTWVIFKSDNDPVQTFWLGKTLSNSEWGNECIWLNNTRGGKDVDGAQIAAGTYAINIQWYTLKDASVPLEYIVEGGDNAQTFVCSNNSLLCTGFEKTINQVLGSRVRVPRQRTIRSNRMNDFDYTDSTRQSLQTSEGEWYRREFGNMYRMDKSVRDLAMERLGQWHNS